VIPDSELTVRFSRSGGPGGQNVNKRDTRVEVIFDVASSPALTPELRRRALARLRGKLDARGRLRVVSSAERTQARPTKAARERRLASKKSRSKVKSQRARPDED
jgi:ribosome-associated protein